MSVITILPLVIAVAALVVAVAVIGAVVKGVVVLRRSGAYRSPVRYEPAAYGLVPREQLDSRRAGPPLVVPRLQGIQAIADAAWDGDWQPAAEFVAAAGQDWDERWSRLELLQEITCSGDQWLEDWRVAQPGNSDAATLHARMLLHRAWEIRGTEYANKVPADRMARFKELLPASMEAARRAALLSPEDPGPWVVMVTAARALQLSHDQFRTLWEGLVARAPHHYDGHWQAMQYWCAKWFGSNKLMLEFAERAVRNAPAGSPLAAVYLHALKELEKRGGALALLSSAESKNLLEEVARSLNQVPDTDERIARLRHLLAHSLCRAGHYEAALDQFRRIGPWCGAEPWTEAGDPVAAFDQARGTAAKNAKQWQPAGA